MFIQRINKTKEVSRHIDRLVVVDGALLFERGDPSLEPHLKHSLFALLQFETEEKTNDNGPAQRSRGVCARLWK